MISYRTMDATCLLTTCLHKGPIPLAQCQAPASVPAYVETIADIPQGSVARVLRSLSERYGACGVVAVQEQMVVGKIRCYPQVVCDRLPGACVQQEGPFRALLALDIESLPARDQAPTLRIDCFQVAEEHRGQGIAGGMLDTLIEWAKAAGWKTLTANAIRQIPPLLNWCGQAGCESLRRRGFVVVSEQMNPELREGVVSQRGGFHGPQVQHEWNAFTEVSDDEAATLFEMMLVFRENDS